MHTISSPGSRRRSWWQHVLAVGALLVTVAAPVRSQTISGMVVDSATAEPLAGSDVYLFDARGDTVAVTKAGTDGRFTVAVRAGKYRLWVRCPGHRPKSTPVDLTEDTVVSIRLMRLGSREDGPKP